jgi:hypothetical protein
MPVGEPRKGGTTQGCATVTGEKMFENVNTFGGWVRDAIASHGRARLHIWDSEGD